MVRVLYLKRIQYSGEVGSGVKGVKGEGPFLDFK